MRPKAACSPARLCSTGSASPHSNAVDIVQLTFCPTIGSRKGSAGDKKDLTGRGPSSTLSTTYLGIRSALADSAAATATAFWATSWALTVSPSVRLAKLRLG